VNLVRVDRQVDAADDLLIVDGDVQVLDLEQSQLVTPSH
jgi:hypothetical protein